MGINRVEKETSGNINIIIMSPVIEQNNFDHLPEFAELKTQPKMKGLDNDSQHYIEYLIVLKMSVILESLLPDIYNLGKYHKVENICSENGICIMILGNLFRTY